jgi:hypothetical protein
MSSHKSNALTYNDASTVLTVDFDAGKLFWRPRPLEMFKTKHDCDSWNSRFAGRETFRTAHNSGYRSGCIFYKGYLAHRVIWLLHSGEWPDEQIDHINGDRADNCISNLRAVSGSENRMNMCLGSHNKSGVMGVSWHKRSGKWQARINVDGRLKFISQSEDIADAIAARKAAEIEHGFHANHGRSSRAALSLAKSETPQ